MSKQQKEPNEYEEYHVTWEVEVGGQPLTDTLRSLHWR